MTYRSIFKVPSTVSHDDLNKIGENVTPMIGTVEADGFVIADFITDEPTAGNSYTLIGLYSFDGSTVTAIEPIDRASFDKHLVESYDENNEVIPRIDGGEPSRWSGWPSCWGE